jgi:uncharacterized protein (TIGR01244 family)
MKQDYLQMRVFEVAPEVYVTGQLFETDLTLIAAQNVKSIMDNRPADEAAEPPRSTELAKVAADLGMTFVHFPVEPGTISDEDAAAYAKACEKLERPLVIFGRTASRSIRIWEQAESLQAG